MEMVQHKRLIAIPVQELRHGGSQIGVTSKRGIAPVFPRMVSQDGSPRSYRPKLEPLTIMLPRTSTRWSSHPVRESQIAWGDQRTVKRTRALVIGRADDSLRLAGRAGSQMSNPVRIR